MKKRVIAIPTFLLGFLCAIFFLEYLFYHNLDPNQISKDDLSVIDSLMNETIGNDNWVNFKEECIRDYYEKAIRFRDSIEFNNENSYSYQSLLSSRYTLDLNVKVNVPFIYRWLPSFTNLDKISILIHADEEYLRRLMASPKKEVNNLPVNIYTYLNEILLNFDSNGLEEPDIAYDFFFTKSYYRNEAITTWVVSCLLFILISAIIHFSTRSKKIEISTKDYKNILKSNIDRISKRSSNLKYRSYLLLISGLTVSFIGVTVYSLILPKMGIEKIVDLSNKLGNGKNLFVYITYAAPIAILAFIETVAFFLLKQYRISFEDYKYFHSIELKQISYLATFVYLSEISDKELGKKDIDLYKRELTKELFNHFIIDSSNPILKEKETTVHLELSKKAHDVSLKNTLDALVDTIKSQRQEEAKSKKTD